MAGRVDVLAFDEPVDGERRAWVTNGAVVVGALAVGYGVLQAQLLLGLLVAGVALAVRAVVLLVMAREVRTRYRAIDAGRGADVVAAHEDEVRRRDRVRLGILGVVALATLGYGLVRGSLLLGVIAAGVVGSVGLLQRRGSDGRVPRLVEQDVRRERAAELYELADENPDERAVEA